MDGSKPTISNDGEKPPPTEPTWVVHLVGPLGSHMNERVGPDELDERIRTWRRNNVTVEAVRCSSCERPRAVFGPLGHDPRICARAHTLPVFQGRRTRVVPKVLPSGATKAERRRIRRRVLGANSL